MFYYDSRCRRQAIGAILDAIGGNAPFIVNRETGELKSTGTARPTEEYLAEYIESRRRIREGWPVDLDGRCRVPWISLRCAGQSTLTTKRTTVLRSELVTSQQPGSEKSITVGQNCSELVDP